MIYNIWSKHLDNRLTPNYSKRYVLFNKSMNLSGEVKKRLTLEAIAKMNSNKSLNKLYSIIESWNFIAHGKITQRSVVKFNAISKKTVEKYWKEFKDYIESFNQEMLCLKGN